MSESVQNTYANNLPTAFGYPLWTPEPSTSLPESYQEDGLQIGDVGYVDDYGKFHVLFNIRYSSDHELHEHGVPEFDPITLNVRRDIDVTANAIPPQSFIGSRHIQQETQSDERTHYRFRSSSSAGSILVLPFGAIRHELKEREEFRKIATENALHWCAFAKKDSLYLITGLHKARSWSLGSFHDASDTGEILVTQPDNANAGIHEWHCGFSVNWRSGPRDDQNECVNQTVFICGYKIAVRWWAPVPTIEWIPRSHGAWVALCTVFVGILVDTLKTLWRIIVLGGSADVRHAPQLSPPFHPADVINRYLLDKNPQARVAVTHDSEWMVMFETGELTHENMTQEDYLWERLAEKYTCVSHEDVVSLERKGKDINELCGSVQALGMFTLPNISDGNRYLVITRLRTEHITAILTDSSLLVGLYVLVQFDSTERKTKTQSIPMCENIIEWEDEIPIPTDPSATIRVTVCASFEIEPVLGNGRMLCTSEMITGDLIAPTTLVMFPSMSAGPRPSLLITWEQRHQTMRHNEDHWERSSVMAHETDLGHDALLRYHQEFKEADLRESTDHFERALEICSPSHKCRPAALSNLAVAKFISCQVGFAGSTIDGPIALCLDALDLRPPQHPDRPATLLYLVQALCHDYEKQGCDESLAGEIERHISELREICLKGSPECRAADLICQSFKRCKTITHGTLGELDELISELEAATLEAPINHFDRPNRLENLSIALLKRFEVQVPPSLDDLEQAIATQEDAIRSMPDNHPDLGCCLSNLGLCLHLRFHWLGDIGDLERAFIMQEDAIRLSPEDHPYQSYIVDNLSLFLHTPFHRISDTLIRNDYVAPMLHGPYCSCCDCSLPQSPS